MELIVIIFDLLDCFSIAKYLHYPQKKFFFTLLTPLDDLKDPNLDLLNYYYFKPDLVNCFNC
jgi:hypothetical protein